MFCTQKNVIQIILFGLSLTFFLSDRAPAANPNRSLESDFANPPMAVKPGVWWFWGESLTTDHGITQDLEALKRVGFGGVVLYEQVFTDHPDALKSLSPEFLDRVKFAAGECKRLGMTLEVNSACGYVSGGPWITPELSMQRLVDSEVTVDGAQHLRVPLPQPPTKLGFYRDVAVLAYPIHELPLPQPKFTGSAGIDASLLFTANARQKVVFPSGTDAIVSADFGVPVTLRAITYHMTPKLKALVIATQMPGDWSETFLGQGMIPIPDIGQLEASDDGSNWRLVRALPGLGRLQDTWDQRTFSFPATTARYFRLNLRNWNPPGRHDSLALGGVQLIQEARVDQWETKSANAADLAGSDQTPAYHPDECIDPAKIVNLSGHLSRDGTLDWEAPPGQWRIMRIGHTPTGARSKHGRPEGEGLESDKLNAVATKMQFDQYVGRLLDAVRQVPGAHVTGVNMDSAESGSQNWTEGFLDQFQQHNGYDLLPFLPAMFGKVVQSPTACDRVLFDLRRTLADRMASECFGQWAALCHQNGMTYMAEAPGIATCGPSDNILDKATCDVPMGETWITHSLGTMDNKEAACAAHLYGHDIAATEYLTGSMADVTPAMVKPLGDASLALGINRFLVLAYLHQPWDDDRLPGVTQDRFYLPFQRHNTWWEYSGGYWDSLARSSLMMRQGKPVIDLLYHLGNNVPLKIITARMRPVPPAGYDYDVCGDDVLIHRLRVDDSCHIILPDGMSYRLLVLAGGEKMTLAAARKLESLVRAGAVVLANDKLNGSPSYADGPDADVEVRHIADELWGPAPLSKSGVNRFGKGMMFWGQQPENVLQAIAVPKDFEAIASRPSADKPDVLYAHRRDGDNDIYFVANHRNETAVFDGLFRVTGKIAEAWDPETGRCFALDEAGVAPMLTRVPLQLEPEQSLFVVFQQSRRQLPELPALVESLPVQQTIDGPWSVHFTPGRGAPDKMTFPKLFSWTESPDDGIRHYSGTARYETSFDLPEASRNKRLMLDLGNVDVVAAVTVNGQSLGKVWKAPYAVEISTAVHGGQNRLVVEVANLWVNRLIADSGLPPEKRVTWTSWNPYRPTDALLPSGLLGPVTLRRVP